MFSEMFEWLDNNTHNEDRCGYCVVIQDGKIRPANQNENPIGVVAPKPHSVGLPVEHHWKDKFDHDQFGRLIDNDISIINIQYKENGITVNKNVSKEQLKEIQQQHSNVQLKAQKKEKGHTLNEAFNAKLKYVARSYRPEWENVILGGRAIVLNNQHIPSNWICLQQVSAETTEYCIIPQTIDLDAIDDNIQNIIQQHQDTIDNVEPTPIEQPELTFDTVDICINNIDNLIESYRTGFENTTTYIDRVEEAIDYTVAEYPEDTEQYPYLHNEATVMNKTAKQCAVDILEYRKQWIKTNAKIEALKLRYKQMIKQNDATTRETMYHDLKQKIEEVLDGC